MPPKTKKQYKKRPTKKGKKTSLVSLIKKVIHGQAETKQAVQTYNDYQRI